MPRTGIIASPGDTRHDFPCLIQLARHGLCNRLRGMAGIGALADLARVDLVVHWEAQPQCRCWLTNVFIPVNCAVMPSAKDVHKFNALRVFDRTNSTRNSRYYARWAAGQEDEFWAHVLRRMRELPLLPRYAIALDAFMSTLPKDVIGVHVRRTDLCSHERDPELWEALDIECGTDKDATFLLCADNRRTVKDMVRRYGRRVRWRRQRMRRTRRRAERHTAVADAAIDLYSLARTRRIIGTDGSSFSSYAARLGDIPLLRI